MSTPLVVLVTFVGPRRTIDAAADAELPLQDLLGPVQEILGVDTTTGTGADAAWLLPAGDEARSRHGDLTRSLAQLGAVDGDVITFVPVTRPVRTTP